MAHELDEEFQRIISPLQSETRFIQAAHAFRRTPSVPLPAEARAETEIYRLGIVLNDSTPLIWRRLDIRSDVTLEALHRAIQGAFDWHGTHLYRFAQGDPFDLRNMRYLTELEIRESGEESMPVTRVPVKDALRSPGDTLDYVYDYGDHWDLTITLESTRDFRNDDPVAICVDGERAGPPDDCGGLRDAIELDEVLDDPDEFNRTETNSVIAAWLRHPTQDVSQIEADWAQTLAVTHPLLGDLIERCRDRQSRNELIERVQALSERPVILHIESDELIEFDESSVDVAAALQGVTSYLERARQGIKLTSSGYVPPQLARELEAELLPGALRQQARGGESKMLPLLSLREQLQQYGLVRTVDSRLISTGICDVGTDYVWEFLADQQVPEIPALAAPEDHFIRDVALLTLLVAATSEGCMNFSVVARYMTDLGWRFGDEPINSIQVGLNLQNPAILLGFIGNIDERSWLAGRGVSPAAIVFARHALRSE